MTNAKRKETASYECWERNRGRLVRELRGAAEDHLADIYVYSIDARLEEVEGFAGL
jgi:hypothetical protein